ncbi:putative TetR family transcriptional regulator [Gordonia effusa NBRC 100432]|uniref:Putative TetR family transcriptional regulator n=1 Tax=Gordonia effusa NBRC 100432 TaxID=1077974 RepID=H0R1D4_9ACTN|nr:TetR/AcrR family transcriptional regulator [Gordonia effusa]GAB18885.1 putative TetR family transcriptional regulator [Gordonia effusa NBRC 100432]
MAAPAKLTMPAIVDAAIDLADVDGLAALSMRKLADRLGVGAMSLYRHVADKDQLVREMAEEAGRRFRYPIDEPGPWTWRERVQIAVDVDWALYERHPWMVLAYASPRFTFSKTSVECLRWLADGLAELGRGEDKSIDMALAVWNLINGVALAMVADSLIAEQGLERSDVVPQVDLKERLDSGIEYLCRGFVG